MTSPKSDIPPKTPLALRKALGTAPRTMASGDAHTADSTAPSTTGPDAVPSIFGPHPPVTPPVNPQTDSPIFSLARELRDMIYAYTFTPNFKAPVDGNPQTVELGDLAATAPSSAFLLTCRYIEQEAATIFRAAQRSFWNDNISFSVDLNDDWEGEDARKERHFEVLDLLDEAFLFPELSDDQVNAMETLIITVKSDIGNFRLHLTGRVHHQTKHWVLDRNASAFPTWSNGVIAEPWPFEQILGIFRAGTSYQSGLYLDSVQDYFRSAVSARKASGRRYKPMSARSEMLAKLAVKRAALAANPPIRQSTGVKKQQLSALLEICWVVFRARRAI